MNNWIFLELIMMSNFHTHNHLCKHAGGTASDYVKEAIKHGYKEIGISDHGPLPNQPFPRMSMQEFNEIYLVEIAEARLKYGNQIKIYSGLEIEYLDDIDNYYRQLLKKLDYLILGCHYYSSGLDIKEKSSYEINNRKKLAEYTKLIKKALSTKMFRVLAHPDLFMCGYQKFDKYARKYSIRIIKCANKFTTIKSISCCAT